MVGICCCFFLKNSRFFSRIYCYIFFGFRRGYVRADHVMKFRRLLSKLLPDVKGLTEEEKDPEEFLNGLFDKIFKLDPFLRFR